MWVRLRRILRGRVHSFEVLDGDRSGLCAVRPPPYPPIAGSPVPSEKPSEGPCFPRTRFWAGASPSHHRPLPTWSTKSPHRHMEETDEGLGGVAPASNGRVRSY
jgi:hypothetical protein